jgi:Copper transport outer membrane protein, MctB
MVNFRFHLVSLIAVFLALGLGILTGSAVVNQATVKAIRREIGDVRREVNSLRSANGDLQNDVARSNSFMADAATYTVDGRLVDVPVVVLAERGLNDNAVGDTVALLRASGAEVPAVIWLEDKWTVDNEQDLQALRNASDLLGGAKSVRTRALEKLAVRLAAPPAAPIIAEPTVPDLLQRLTDAGFISISADNVDLTSFPPSPSRAVVITGTDSRFEGTDVTLAVTRAATSAQMPTLVGEVYTERNGDKPPKRGDAVAAVRNDKSLGGVVSTVDDLDLVQGRVASVLALQELGAGTAGHYGYGNGATSSLPPQQQKQ